MSEWTAASRSDAVPVAALVAHLGAVIRADEVLADVSVSGELSNYRIYASGHHYFTLKDAAAEMRCVMFRGDAQRLRFEPGDGQAVIARGRVDVYEKRGEVQLYVRAMSHDGLGGLYQAFERLRQRLEAEGLFATERKRSWPRYPRRVAVITSPSGAAVRDMIRVLRQRWPAVRILFHEAVVQGEEAAPSLVRALTRVNQVPDVDLILFGRGGGSMEDLWAFNEEPVARAVAASRIPVISAVGHETDFTISDFVADARAATPTHAAQLAVPDVGEVARHLAQLSGRLAGSLRRRVEHGRAALEALARRRVLTAPEAYLEQRAQRLDELGERLPRAAQRRWQQAEQRLETMSRALTALDPTAVLQRGYAILTRDSDGQAVRQPADLPPGERATALVAGGSLTIEAV